MMKNKHLLEIELYEKLPDIIGAFSYTRVKKCPLDEGLYRDFCMDYGCPHMKEGICEHPDREVIREGWIKS